MSPSWMKQFTVLRIVSRVVAEVDILVIIIIFLLFCICYAHFPIRSSVAPDEINLKAGCTVSQQKKSFTVI